MTIVIGTSDTGKTMLVTRLAGQLASRGLRVAVVDADLGQSEIGPPTTIGLGRVDGPLPRLAAAHVEALYFVGATSAAHALRATALGTGAMVARARAAGFDRVLVDTSGLIAPGLGGALKEAKIRAVDPDLLVCLQRATGDPAAARPGTGAPALDRRAATTPDGGARSLLRDRAGGGDRSGAPGGRHADRRARGHYAARATVTVETPVARGTIAGVVLGRETYPR